MREIPRIYRAVFPTRLLRDVVAAQAAHPNPIFAEGLLARWSISYTYCGPALPARGGAIVAANHPTGVLDGVLLNALLQRWRPDLRILANSLLQAFEPLAGVVIAINPFGKAARENGLAIRQALHCLRRGGVLVMFPAGEVAHWTWKARAIAEPPWLDTAARLAVKANVPVYPLHLCGTNRLRFHLSGLLHPRLRTLLLLHELDAKRGSAVRVTAGEPVPPQLLAALGAREATRLLRAKSLELATAPQTLSTKFRTSAIGL